MISYIKIIVQDIEGNLDNKVIELRSGERLSLQGEFWPREMKFLNDLVSMMIDFNKTEKAHTPVKRNENDKQS